MSDMKRISALLMAVVLAAGLCACAPKEPAETPPPQSTPAETPASENTPAAGQPEPQAFEATPLELSKITLSDIDVETVTVNSGIRTGSYIRISGLKDKTVQDAINSAIESRFNSLMFFEEPPAYAGMKVRLKNAGEMSGVWCNSYDYGSVSNILSVSFYYGASYDSEEWFSWTAADSMNFDLRTGELLSLKDLFRDDIDWKDYVNSEVLKALDDGDPTNELSDWYYYGPKLRSSFTGVRDDQKFFLNGYNGSVTLIFDWNDPDFYINFSIATIELPLTDAYAYAEKYSGTDIYENDAPLYRLLNRQADASELISENGYTNPIEGDSDFFLAENVSYFKDVPQEKIDEYKEIFAAGLDECIAEYSRLREQYGADITGGQDTGISAYRISKYTCLSFSSYCTISTRNDWANLFNKSVQTYYTYVTETGEPFGINDLFKPEADMRSLLIEAFKSNEQSYLESDPENLTFPENYDDFIAAAIERINGVSVSADTVQFSYDDLSALALEYFGESAADEYRYKDCLSYASYAELGCENLTIFD